MSHTLHKDLLDSLKRGESNYHLWSLPNKDSQEWKILVELSKDYVPLPKILKLNVASHTKVISMLRARGFKIECIKTFKNKRVGKKEIPIMHTEYILDF